MIAERRIQKEYENMKADAIPGLKAAPIASNPFHWRAQLDGPAGSPYEGGCFVLDIRIPSRYPLEPPKVTFHTQIFHPNVNDRGDICLDVLRSSWSPALSLQKVILSISSLLTDPNFSDPLNEAAASLYRKSKALYNSKCEEYTSKYAMSKEGDVSGASSSSKRKAAEISSSAGASSGPAPRPKAKAKAAAKAKAKASPKPKAKVKAKAKARR
eukprot:gnl/MRDRNA2_/MRDRNA2_14265_c0_seq1.p1 gnl/MRDRNA2_/MRDRNA2_14265_c0~~gnl/MRDRNA2_/MRDRNA2_14265_c0_seq1.p1  ORF type:complete len:213 (-),score=47.94 gnl/MRDRNA2_/MRDRNA2_14265_c0_seq1:89-727(-)